jgi:hypothetical protein
MEDEDDEAMLLDDDDDDDGADAADAALMKANMIIADEDIFDQRFDREMAIVKWVLQKREISVFPHFALSVCLILSEPY